MMTVRTWHRECYKFPNWAHKIGYGDGFARSHWMSSREECQGGIDATTARGGEAFMETFTYREETEDAWTPNEAHTGDDRGARQGNL